MNYGWWALAAALGLVLLLVYVIEDITKAQRRRRARAKRRALRGGGVQGRSWPDAVDDGNALTSQGNDDMKGGA